MTSLWCVNVSFYGLFLLRSVNKWLWRHKWGNIPETANAVISFDRMTGFIWLKSYQEFAIIRSGINIISLKEIFVDFYQKIIKKCVLLLFCFKYNVTIYLIFYPFKKVCIVKKLVKFNLDKISRMSALLCNTTEQLIFLYN